MNFLHETALPNIYNMAPNSMKQHANNTIIWFRILLWQGKHSL